MKRLDDSELLAAYAAGNSEEAFTELADRYVALVYSAAMRQVGEPQLAGEITQAVFLLLARKARAMSRHATLSGWLCRVAYFVSRDALRAERRRLHREQIALQMQNNPADESWTRIAPLLDEAVAQLSAKDRSAIVLRYYEQKSLGEVGSVLGVNSDTAQKRVSRALEKLRRFFVKRGVASTTAMIAGAITANSVQAAPSALAKSVTAIAMAKGAAASGSSLTLIKGALKIMAWTKIKTAIIGGVVVLIAAGTTTVTIKEIQEHRRYPWQAADHDGLFDAALLNQQPPQVRILPSKFTSFAEGRSGDKLMGTGLTAQAVVAAAYGGSSPRTILYAGLPKGKFDYIASLPGGNAEALQQEVTRRFGVAGKIETRDADVMVLKMKSANGPGLKRSNSSNQSMLWKDPQSRLEFRSSHLGYIAGETEALANIPVIDETGITNRFDFDLNCKQADLVNRNWDNVNRALEPLGLKIVPSNEPITMLVVERAK
jgi:uncharacterized protein (TIGR03435 family)